MQAKHKNIHFSEPRTHIRATLENKNIVLEAPTNTTIGDIFDVANSVDDSDIPIIASICNNELRELTYPLKKDSTIRPIRLNNSDGGRIYRRSLVMLLATAAAQLWDGCQLNVSYAVPDGGFYCTRVGATPFTQEEIVRLESRMREIVTENHPITKRIAPIEEAHALFKQRNEHDKARLLAGSKRTELVLYTLLDRDDYYYGYMVRSTAVLTQFKLIWDTDGFILQYPRKESPLALRQLQPYGKLRRVFQQTEDWLYKMSVNDIGQLNHAIIQDNHIHELILVAEALHEQNIAQIASQITKKQTDSGIRLILIAGPSSSGKTTFAKRLAIQLLAHGLRPFTLELDNYFVDRVHTPLDENGEYDFEALQAIDLTLFNQHLLSIIAGESVTLPKFNFISGEREEGRTVKLSDNQIVIVEGIHGLNPGLVPHIPKDRIFRIYVSALTQLNIDGHNRIPTTDVRLIRRIVRDAHHRGYSATDTLERWQSVRRGEKINIFPYQENADAMFNSALLYELAALRPLAEPLLLQVKYGTHAHIEAKRLLSFLSWVYTLSTENMAYIPDTSLLREFIGKSSLENYYPNNLNNPTVSIL